MRTIRGRIEARERPVVAGGFALALLAGLWGWWAWQDGAWFGVVLLPGTIVLCAGLMILSWVAPARIDLRRAPAAVVALAALAALGIWAALSALWSPAPNVAVADGQRILVYAAMFGLGLWAAALLGRRAGLAVVPLAAAGAFAGLVTAAAMIAAGDPASLLEDDGTLEFPLGYRNANAAFFAIAFFPALGIAANPDLGWRLRGAALATATSCLAIAMLSQSRASVPAAAVALVAYALWSPLRLRTICWLALAALPAIAVIPALSDLYRVSNELGVDAAGDELRAAGVVLVLAAVAALALGAAAARFEHRLPGLGSRSPRANRGVALTLALGVAAIAAATVVAVGDPIDWASDRAEEFRSGSPSFGGESSRFTLNFGTDRYDLWRVAIDDLRSEPLRGTGGGGFQYSYLRDRDSEHQTARDAHSVELGVAGELGAPGLALLLTALAAAATGAIRARRRGPQATAISAVALASGAYWLAHASLEWLWAYPAITAPALALLGSACGAGLTIDEGRPPRLAGRAAVVAAAAALALSAIPPFLSERYVNEAYAGWRTDLARSYRDLARARALNPLTDVPLLAEGAIAEAAGDRSRAIAAFREAAAERPEEWAGHFLLAELLAREDPARARRELAVARSLNPRSPEIARLERRIDALERRQRGSGERSG